MMGGAMAGPDDKSDEPLPPEEEAAVDRPFEDVFGVSFEFADDDTAPPVEIERIRRHARNELSAVEAAEVRGLIAKYRSWFTAWRNALWQEAEKRAKPSE
jgi:hypothetical protein